MYCLNLRPGESLSEVIDVIRGDVAAVKRAIAPEHSYEIGLRLGNRAAAPLPVAARYCGAWHGIVHTLRVLHAAACQRGLPARGTVRGRAAHPARCHDRAAIYPRALPGRRDGDIAPYRHYTRNIRTLIARGGSRLAPPRHSDSGSQSQLDNMILQGEPIHPDIYNNFLESTMPGMLRDTAYFHLSGNNGQPRDCYALGYTLYAYLQNHDDGDGVREDLKMLSYEGVSPTDETLLTGDYPLVDGYYAVLRKDTPKDSSTRKLLSWMLGEDFAQVMQGNGFFPVAKNKIR